MGTHTETSPSAETGSSWKEALFNPRVSIEFGVEEEAFGRDQQNHEKFIEIIKEVDNQFPWRNQSGKKCFGIRAVSSEFVEDIDFGPRVLVSFKPYDIQLRRGQFIAYYNYTVNLGKVIAMMGIEGVDSVSVKIDLLGVFNFFKSK